MDRKKIENITASLAVVLLFATTLTGILFVADLFFEWDIFPPGVEKILGFVMFASAAVIFSSVLVNVMINLGIIALYVERFVELYDKHREK